jgi:DNA (cytosine-5)-methyltransferase 1
MGFDARWGVLGAADVGANHQRDRIWIVATNVVNAKSSRDKRNAREFSKTNEWQTPERQEEWVWQSNNASEIHGKMANASSLRQQGQGQHEQSIHSEKGSQRQTNYAQSIGASDQWTTEPNVGRVADGVAARVDRLKAIGNGQVPLCAATAWRILGGE